MSRSRTLQSLLVIGSAAAAALSQGQLYGVGATSAGYDFYSINTSTGAATSLFSFSVAGATNVVGLTYIPTTNKFVTVAQFNPWSSKLVELDLGAQTANVVGTGVPLNGNGTTCIEGLEYMSSQGGLVVSHGIGGYYSGKLALLNPLGYGLMNTTTQLLADGDTLFDDGTGTVNVMDSNNPTGGFMRNKVNSPFSGPTLSGYGSNMFGANDSDFAWKADEGRLFLTEGNVLSEVNASSTSITQIGSYGNAGVRLSITGIAAKPTPEPASMAALAIGGLGLLRRRHRA